MKRLGKGVAALLGVTLFFFVSKSQAHEEKPQAASAVTQTPHLSVIRKAPDFALKGLNGEAVALSAFRGKPVLVAFIYTGCTTACPLLSARMARLQQKLAQARVPAALVSVSVDPGDDAKALAAYAKRFGAKPGWHFVRGDAPALSAYEEWTARTALGELDHPARLHLIDARGRVREIYSLAFFDEEQAFYDIRALISSRSP
jgi:protein SCO1